METPSDMSRALRLATAAVQRVPIIPPITTCSADALTLTEQQGQGFHVNGHREATPVAGSDGTAALAGLKALHASFTVPAGSAVVPLPTKGERDLALAHANEGGCSLCAAFLNGLARGARGGAAIQRQRTAQQRRPRQ
jgi:hypothetical protein